MATDLFSFLFDAKRLFLFVLVSCSGLASGDRQKAVACATAVPAGSQVAIADESAIIVWDAAHQTEHFIRHATFHSTAKDFGFLVPSPTAPALNEISNDSFAALEQLIRPPVMVQERRHYVLSSLRDWFQATIAGSADDAVTTTASNAATGGSSGTVAPPVQVIQTQQVAGYDATVLAADDPQALNGWLQAHGYTASADTLEWLRPYVAAHWKITAFKIAPSVGAVYQDEIHSSSVKMSFSTAQPFFPYREPASARAPGQPHGPRLLRVFCVSTQRVTGALGKAGQANSWPGQTYWAKPLEADTGSGLRDNLHLAAPLPPRPWLTVFQDSSSPRPGTDDVYFARETDQSTVLPPPVYAYVYRRTPVPVEPIVFLALLGTGLGVRRRNRQRVPAL